MTQHKFVTAIPSYRNYSRAKWGIGQNDVMLAQLVASGLLEVIQGTQRVCTHDRRLTPEAKRKMNSRQLDKVTVLINTVQTRHVCTIDMRIPGSLKQETTCTARGIENCVSSGRRSHCHKGTNCGRGGEELTLLTAEGIPHESLVDVGNHVTARIEEVELAQQPVDMLNVGRTKLQVLTKVE
jgi:hypothetical protein